MKAWMLLNESSVLLCFVMFECVASRLAIIANVQQLCFHPPIFMAFLNIALKMLDGNAKMCIDSKNVYKKLMRSIESDKFFIR